MRTYFLKLPFLCLLCMPASAWAAPPTVAASCPSGKAPALFDGEACGSHCTVALVVSPFYELHCSADDEASLVRDFDGSNFYSFSAFGTDDGTDWCCYVSDLDDLINVSKLVGGSQSDSLSHKSGSASLSGSGGQFVAIMDGKGGDDTLTGTGYSYTYFYERLYGRAGTDELIGNAGDDYMVGGADPDGLWGNAGADVLIGGSGSDWLYGGVGANTLCGGGSNDALDGDQFYNDGPGTGNVFWEEYTLGFNPPYGEVSGLGVTCGSTSWTSGWAGAGCSYTLSTEPAGCTVY